MTILRSGIHSFVVATNNALASIQSSVNAVSKPITKGISSVDQEVSYLAHQVHTVYSRRHEFGVPLVAGSALTFGAITTVRKNGRIFPGALSALLAGGITYLLVYETTTIDIEDIPDILLGDSRKKP